MKLFKTALRLMLVFTFITGIVYPLVITGLAQWLFPWQANGSVIEVNGKLVGSMLIGQSFTDDKYFWSRPSATTPYPYNAANSSGSNMGPSNPDFLASVKDRALKLTPTKNNSKVPVDLVTASGSGLDPDITPLAAYFQISRIAKARHLNEADLQMLVYNHTKNRTYQILGEPRVNVLELNLALNKGL